MFQLVAIGKGDEMHAALMVLVANGVKIEGDGTDDDDPTWIKATFADGSVLTWPETQGTRPQGA